MPSLRQNRIVQWGVILLVMAIVIVPVLFVWIPREAARWHFASAIEYHFEGDDDRALAELDKAARFDPENLEIVFFRGRILSEKGQLEPCLELYQKAIQSYCASHSDMHSDSNFNTDFDSYRLYSQTADILQRLGRHGEAVELWDRFIEPREKEFNELCKAGLSEKDAAAQTLFYAEALNGRAYTRARAGIQLDEALADVEKSMRLHAQGERDYALLDTRGYIHYQRGELPEARRNLDQAIRLAEEDLLPYIKQLKEYAEKYNDHYQIPMALEDARGVMAVVYHHAGLLYEKLDQPDRAKPLLQKAEQGGYSPERGIW